MHAYEVRPRKDHRGVDLISIIAFGLLTICTQCFGQGEEEPKLYEQFPELRAHEEVVLTAYEQLKQSGFQAKTWADANRAVAIRAYVLLNQSSGTTMPYRQVLEECNWARSEYPALKDMSLPEFAGFMNEKTGSRAFDEGLNDSWLRRVGASIHTSFV